MMILTKMNEYKRLLNEGKLKKAGDEMEKAFWDDARLLTEESEKRAEKAMRDYKHAWAIAMINYCTSPEYEDNE